MQANPYQLGFILTADGLSGEEDSWTQKNYYPNNTEYTDTDMELFTQGDGYVYDLTYNMVAIGFSGPSFIEGSLPEQIEADKDYEYTFRFDLSKDSQTCKAKSILAGQQNYKLRAVALLIDSTTGEVVNARKAKVGGETDGVSALTVNKDATPVAYYMPDGRQLQSPTKGINIVRLADGRTVKMIVRKQVRQVHASEARQKTPSGWTKFSVHPEGIPRPSRRPSKPFSCELPKSSERKTCKKHRVGRGEKLKIKGFMRVNPTCSLYAYNSLILKYRFF